MPVRDTHATMVTIRVSLQIRSTDGALQWQGRREGSFLASLPCSAYRVDQKRECAALKVGTATITSLCVCMCGYWLHRNGKFLHFSGSTLSFTVEGHCIVELMLRPFQHKTFPNTTRGHAGNWPYNDSYYYRTEQISAGSASVVIYS